jgi:hypothetical protein
MYERIYQAMYETQTVQGGPWRQNILPDVGRRVCGVGNDLELLRGPCLYSAYQVVIWWPPSPLVESLGAQICAVNLALGGAGP